MRELNRLNSLIGYEIYQTIPQMSRPRDTLLSVNLYNAAYFDEVMGQYGFRSRSPAADIQPGQSHATSVLALRFLGRPGLSLALETANCGLDEPILTVCPHWRPRQYPPNRSWPSLMSPLHLGHALKFTIYSPPTNRCFLIIPVEAHTNLGHLILEQMRRYVKHNMHCCI